MTIKKFLAIIFGIILIALIAFLVFFYFFKTTPEGEPEEGIIETVKDFFPFGKVDAPNGNNLNPSTPDNTIVNNSGNNFSTTSPDGQKIPKLRKIYDLPTAGGIVIARETSTTTGKKVRKITEYFIRFMDRGNGHIYETKTNSLEQNKISNVTIPKVYSADFSTSGNNIIARMLDENNVDTIKTYSITLRDKVIIPTKKPSASAASTTATSTDIATSSPNFKEVTGIYLNQNIKELALSPSKTKILESEYVGEGGALSTIGTDGKNKKTIFTSSLREWLLNFGTESRATITTKPTGTEYGFSYILDTGTGGFSKLISGVPGLTTLPSRDFSYVLIGSGGNGLSLNVLRLRDGNKTNLGGNTLPEKCVWARKKLNIFYCAVPKAVSQGIYPDNWYQGKISFSDNIWKFDATLGTSELIATPETLSGIAIDATNLDISPNDLYLTFINKKDLSFWGFDLEASTPSF